MVHKAKLYQNSRYSTLNFLSVATISISVFVMFIIFWDLEGFLRVFPQTYMGWMLIGFVATIFLSMVFVLLWISGRYVLTIREIDDSTLVVSTWSVWGKRNTHLYPKSILEPSFYTINTMCLPDDKATQSFWIPLKTPKGKDLIVDLQGVFYEQEGIGV